MLKENLLWNRSFDPISTRYRRGPTIIGVLWRGLKLVGSVVIQATLICLVVYIVLIVCYLWQLTN